MDSYELGIRDVREFFSFRQFLLLPKKAKGLWKTLQNMEGEEERGSVREENSQQDAAADETIRQNYVTYEQVSDGIHAQRV